MFPGNSVLWLPAHQMQSLACESGIFAFSSQTTLFFKVRYHPFARLYCTFARLYCTKILKNT